MIRVECASYGAAGSAHGWLGSSIPREQLPGDLAGIVDKPQYHPDGALPLLACAPMPPFFAVWRTLEDPGAPRAGMVRSYVALIELSAIADLRSLAEVTGRLPTQLLDVPFNSPFDIDAAEAPRPVVTLRYESLCENLAAASRRLPVIVPDEGDWEVLLTMLWSFLWPEARLSLTCLHASGPEAMPATDPTILVTLRSAVNKWVGYPIVDHVPARTNAAKFLRGEPTPEMEQLRFEIGSMPSDPRMLSLLERAAALLELERNGNARILDLKVLIEAVLRLDPGTKKADALISRLIERLSGLLGADASSDGVLSLSNLDLSSHDVGTVSLERAVRNWVERWLVQSDPGDAAKMLRRVRDERFVAWWRAAIRDALRSLLVPGDLGSWEAVWTWAVQRPEVLEDLRQEVGLDDRAESIIARACPRSVSAELAIGGIAIAVAQGWPRVHAAVVAGAFAPRQALERQLRFPVRGRDGLGLLLERLNGPELVELSLSFDEEELRRRAANATVAAPGLLSSLDATSPAWLDLWQRAISIGLPAWAGIRDRVRVADVVLESVVSGMAIDRGILLMIASDLPILSNGIPEGFWSRVDPQVATAYARALAVQWLASLSGPTPPRPTPRMFPAVFEVFAEQVANWSFRLEFLPRAIELSGDISFLKRLINGPVAGIVPAVARELGLCVQRFNDSELASAAFVQWERGRSELEPLLMECASLLGRWQRWRLPSKRPPSDDDSRDLFVELRKLACDLHPEGLPDHVWEDAGGKAWALPQAPTGEERWALALSATERRANGAPGIARLLEVIRSGLNGGPNAERLSIIQRRLEGG